MKGFAQFSNFLSSDREIQNGLIIHVNEFKILLLIVAQHQEFLL